eukprot:TRINITY_DN7947_c0_g1_i3.p2 TRINITY_DN7947_c0_g1~~TRINITY_DN7947_c0_g1_i3.p2  ORF type:complete len:149 (-),score=24.18 TRINITY_DN7947_c0_g1_i3:44-490(-)
MSPRPKKATAAPEAKPKVFRRKRSAPEPVARDVAPDFSKTPLDQIPLSGLSPRALIAPNFRVYELSRSDLAARQGIDNSFANDGELRAAIHLARHVLQPIRDKFGSFSPNSVYRSQKPVSYTHLTLPTICSVQISVVAVSLKKKTTNC